MVHEPTNEEVELVQPEGVDAAPLAVEGEEEGGEVGDGKGVGEAEEEGGETVDEEGLRGGLVGVPEAIEEALPNLLQGIVGDLGLGGKPRMEELHGLGASAAVAGGQLLYQGRWSRHDSRPFFLHWSRAKRSRSDRGFWVSRV